MLRACLFIFLFFGSSFKHDFHTSLTEINFNPKTKSLELSLRVFSDDLENTLSNFNKGKKVKIEDPDSILNPLIEQYVRKNLALISPNKEVKFGKFYGKEKEADATWIYLEIFDCQDIKDFTLYNSIMQEMFSDQTNIVNVIYPTQKKTFVFNSSLRTVNWPF